MGNGKTQKGATPGVHKMVLRGPRRSNGPGAYETIRQDCATRAWSAERVKVARAAALLQAMRGIGGRRF